MNIIIMENAIKLVLIETLWNVKTRKLNTSRVGKTVLIETLWNVKILHSSKNDVISIVLIETLWNVKPGKYVTGKTLPLY